jgi:hypothetical protein
MGTVEDEERYERHRKLFEERARWRGWCAWMRSRYGGQQDANEKSEASTDSSVRSILSLGRLKEDRCAN